MSIEVNDDQLNQLIDTLWRMTKEVSDTEVLKVIRSAAKKELFEPLRQEVSSRYGDLSKSVAIQRRKDSIIVGITKGYSTTSRSNKQKIGGYILRWLEYSTVDRYIKKGSKKFIKSLLRKTRGAVIEEANRKGYRGKEPKKAFILQMFRDKVSSIKSALADALMKKISKLSRG